MSGNYPIHPDLYELRNMMEPLLTMDPELIRLMTDQFRREWNNNVSDEEIIVTKQTILSHDGVPLELQIMKPRQLDTRQAPCLVYYHGGGFMFPMSKFQFRIVREYIKGASCVAVCVDYRLAPDECFPAPAEDCYRTLEWTYQHAADIGVDPRRIVIGGDSAGGLFTAAVSLMARDRSGPGIIGQMLIYPTTDARLQSPSMIKYTDTPVWNAPLTKWCWSLYLKNGIQELPEYASPLEAASLAGLPEAYVEIAEFDCLRDDGLLYAQALEQAGVPTKLVDTKNTTHAFDYAREETFMKSLLIKESIVKRIQFLNQIFEV